MTIYTLRDFDNQLIMIAPLKTIKSIYGLHQSVVERITRETTSGNQCTCYGNGRHADFIVTQGCTP